MGTVTKLAPAPEMAVVNGIEAYNRVPRVTVDFWLIKLMAVTVGETAADFLALNMGIGLQTTTLIMIAVLIVALGLQFTRKRYVPWTYWLAVVLVSVVGTLITDNLVDTFDVPLLTTTIGCSILLAATFAAWFASEKTLSIHTIVTTRREIFYWLAILFTFALGTAVGDYIAETLGLGYLATGLVFLAIIAAIAVAHLVFKADAILFANLIENAIRHCPPGTLITLSAGAEPEKAFSVSVTDTGPGIPEAERDRVFQRLYRLDKSRSTPGHGLGLSLVKAIADLHGASIDIGDNNPGLRITLRFVPQSGVMFAS